MEPLNDSLVSNKENSSPIEQHKNNSAKNPCQKTSSNSGKIIPYEKKESKIYNSLDIQRITKTSLDQENADELSDPEEIFAESSESSSESFQNIVLTKLDYRILGKQNNMILEKLNLIEAEFSKKTVAESNQLSETLLEPLSGFPSASVEEFDELNMDENTEKRLQVYNHLISLGGSNQGGDSPCKCAESVL